MIPSEGPIPLRDILRTSRRLLPARALLNQPSGTIASPTPTNLSIVSRLSSFCWLKYAAVIPHQGRTCRRKPNIPLTKVPFSYDGPRTISRQGDMNTVRLLDQSFRFLRCAESTARLFCRWISPPGDQSQSQFPKPQNRRRANLITKSHGIIGFAWSSLASDSFWW